ncbi:MULTISPECIES: hypothetical protein [Microbacterium]|uniref:hypothetical protein n=1 Tax=Microbacterium TaxID=33882 RepID=UPI00278A0649|nr:MULTISPECIES: hypothetical protein [Microbacterium]MDQ1076923.1 hypothetical protein [Microbacterium sp. SORGH_AS_0969]MDQ1117160.1 hypothetical protein [Microbacterium testaceum]
MKFSTADRRVPDVLEVRTPHAIVTYPDSFVASEYQGAELVLTLRERQDVFQPNLVLTLVDSTAPLTDASAAAILASSQQHPGARVVGVDLWDENPDATLARARCITFVYPAGATDVVVTKTVWATGTHHVHLSASATPAQLGAVGPVFSWIAAQLRLTADAGEVEAAARSVGAAPADADASTRVGFPLEALAPFAPPAFATTAPVVSTAALTELRAGASRTRRGPGSGTLPRRVRGTDAAAELLAAGFIDEGAALTPTGTAVASALGSRTPLLVARVRRGGQAAVLVAFAGPRGVVIAHDPSIGELNAGAAIADPERRHIALVVPEHVPAFVAAWIGLEPFWPIDDAEPMSVATAELEQAVGPGTGGWTDVLLQGARRERYDAIVPGRGWKRVIPPADGAHDLLADPSRAVYMFLVDLCARSLEEGPVSPAR